MKEITVLPTRLNRKKSKRWGFGLVLWSFLAFFVSQIVVSIVILAIYLAVYQNTTADSLTTDALLKFTSQPGVLLPTQFSAYLLWVGYMFYATYKKGLHSFPKDFWLKFKWFDPFLGILIAAVITGVETLLFFLLGKIPGLDLSGSDNGTFLFQSHGFWLYVTTIGLGGIIGPLFEELYFRGFIMQGLIRYFRKGLRNYPVTIIGNNTFVKHPRFYRRYLGFKLWLYNHKYVLAAAITAVLFGSLHYQGGTTFGSWLVPVFTGLIGFVLGLIVLRTRRMGVNIFTHMAFNTISVVLTLLGVSIGS